MDDVKTTLRPIEWTETVKIIDRSSLFPMVVKPALTTSKTYNISEDPILLHSFWITQRIVAQSLEDEGAYVVGPQLEIPAEYSGTFRYRDDQKGNEDVVQTFPSVKEIALSMPEKVFTQERLVVYPQIPLEDQATKVSSVILEPLEQLSVIEKKNINSLLPVSRYVFTGKPKYKYVPVPCVTFIVERTKEMIHLPVTTRGNFSTLPHIPRPGREFGTKGIIHEIDFPINLTTCRNCPQSLLDEHHLRPEMRLRLTAVEEHEVIIGVTTQEKIVEFAADEVEFLMPKHLDGLKDQEIEYQTALQRFLMECQIKHSPVNIKDYKKSIRTHVSRTVRVTNPTALSQVSRNRVCKMNSNIKPAQNGLPAIAFFSSTTNSPSLSRRSSLPSDSQRLLRHSMPLPTPPMNNPDNPPLPPRNNRGRSSLKSLSQSQRPLSARPFSTVAFGDWGELPNRPPPPPPTTEILPPLPPYTPDKQKLSSIESCTDTSFSTTPSTASPEEQVWESLDESYLQKLREDRNSVKKKQDHQSYENFTPVAKQDEYVPDVNATMALLNFDEPERTPSPQFSLLEETSSANNVLNEPSIPVSILVDVENYDSEAQQQIITSTENYENVSPMNLMNGVEDNTATASALEDVQMPSFPDTDEQNEEVKIPLCEDGVSEALNGRKNSISSTSSSSEESEHSRAEFSHRSSSPASNESKIEEKSNGYFHVSQYSVVSEDSNQSTQISFTCNYIPAPQDWIPPSDLSQLSVSEVADSLRYIGMNEDTVEWFRAEKVDGQLLCLIGDEEFTQHFRLTPFQQRKIVMFLKGWRPKIN